jgi:hypothetical protein
MKQVEAEKKKKSVHIQSERPVMTGVKCKKKHNTLLQGASM